MTATNEEINKVVGDFVEAIQKTGILKVMPPKGRSPILHIAPVVNVGNRPIFSASVLLCMAEKMRDTFLEEYPDRVNAFFHAINYDGCMNSTFEHESAILNREIWDPEARLAQLAADAAISLKGKNVEVERKFWNQFLWAQPNYKQYTVYKESFLENSLVKLEDGEDMVWKDRYQERQDFAQTYIALPRNYFEECTKKYPNFPEVFNKEVEALKNHSSIAKGNETDALQQLLLEDFDRTKYLITNEKNIDEKDKHGLYMLDTVIPCLSARSEFMVQSGKEFVYPALEGLLAVEYYLSHQLSHSNLPTELLLYIHQQRVEISEKNADLDLENIRNNTKLLI